MSPVSQRQPGDALPAKLVKDIRVLHGLSQDDFAQRLGVRGGKSVISGWETGRTRCEGPAAELILKVFGESGPDGAPSLLNAVELVWKRAGNHMPAWRQILVVPDKLSVDRHVFEGLFPGTEIPPEQHVHGFPFIGHGHGLPDDVYKLEPDGWTGVVPREVDRPPSYFWRLQTNGAFIYRERIWEDDPMAITGGNIHFGAQFNLVIPAVFFYRRLAERCRFDQSTECRLQLDLEGVRGRSVVAYQHGRALDDFTIDSPRNVLSTNHVSVARVATVADISTHPRSVALGLVGEFAFAVRPDLASEQALEDQLRKRHRQDDGGRLRYLGVLDATKSRWRRARVALDGVPVGLLRETEAGTRFEYDDEYLARDGAVPISPTLPLDQKSFEARGGLLPFFANLLPEGARLSWVAQRHGLDENDRLGILFVTGRDAIGAVEIVPQ
jgi:serine/threonine-protein kinase HipA